MFLGWLFQVSCSEIISRQKDVLRRDSGNRLYRSSFPPEKEDFKAGILRIGSFQCEECTSEATFFICSSAFDGVLVSVLRVPQ